MLGNDIVDLQDAGEKHYDNRFLERVFTTSEQDCIRSSKYPNLVLWMIWAAKESLYKIAAKTESVIFAHKEFAIDSETLHFLHTIESQGEAFSSATFQGRKVFLHFQWNQNYVHCVASLKQQTVFHRIRPMQENPSIEVRSLAQDLIEENTVLKNFEILRMKKNEREMPPAIYSSVDLVANINLSLSHDGRYVAAAIQP